MRTQNTYTDEQYNLAEQICQGTMRPLNSEWIVCLGQSDGSKDVMFVLYRWVKADAIFGTADPMNYCGPLSIDLVTACKKARERCGKMDIRLEAQENNKRASVILMKKYFIEENGEFIERLKKWKTHNNILEDMLSYFERKGKLSESQMNFAEKLIASAEEWMKKRESQKRKDKRLAKREGLFFNEKEKVELTIKKIVEEFSFEGNFGRTYIIKYQTKCGKVVMYKGGNPPQADAGDTIRGTVKHNDYTNRENKEIKQTQLQRIKILTA